ncbi:GumC family protein [Rhodospirillum sp. A1_3_36]|uniref:GumC family protein n=1 Tax=Rhodospirillum sp. A1_3_36 TaxID=3391666 RepID=UPI0039A7548F
MPTNEAQPQAPGLLSGIEREQFQKTIRWGWRIIWRGKGIILSCLLLSLIPTVLILQQTPNKYTASATIVVEAPDASDPTIQQTNNRLMWGDVTIRTQTHIVKSTKLAQRVVEDLKLDQYPEFNPNLREKPGLVALLGWINPMRWIGALANLTDQSKDGDQSSDASDKLKDEESLRRTVLTIFRSKLEVRMERQSQILMIQFTSADPNLSAKIVNSVADQYVTDRLEASLEEARQVSDWLGKRLDTLRGDVAAAESAVELYRQANDLQKRSDRQGTIMDQEMTELNSRLIIARANLAESRARQQRVEAIVRGGGSIESIGEIQDSPVIQRLREQETDLLREISEAANKYGSRHPTMVGLNSDLAQIRGRIRAEMSKIGASIQNEVALAAATVSSLEASLRSAQGNVDKAGEAEIRLGELEREAQSSRELYEAFLARFKRGADQERVFRANARVISPAQVPSTASSPRRGIILLMVTMLSLMFSILLVFVLDQLDNMIRSSDEAEDITHLPTLTLVPKFRGNEAAELHEALDRPRSQRADAIRGLRIGLDLRATQRRRPTGARVIVITSSTPKEGKSFIALNLAAMCTKTGERVLLIDGDVHRPKLHISLDKPNEEGLVQVLSGIRSAKDLILPQVFPGLDFLPAGHLDNMADLISEENAERMLSDLVDQYDRVIIDTAPVLAVADARVLGRVADHVVYVIRWNATPRDAVRNGVKLLRESNVPLSGIVLSQVDQRKHARYAYGDYGQYYGKYRSYYAD